MAKAKSGTPLTLREYVQDWTVALSVGALHLLPYRWRVPVAGWLAAEIVAPLTGMRRRITDNLALARPDLPEAERRRLIRAVPDNLGRFMIELFSPRDFLRVVSETPFEGPGLAAIEAATAEGRGIIAVSGHFGNYDVFRAGMIQRGYKVGGLYRPMNNRAFNTRYVRTIETLGKPLFRRGRQGFGEMLRFLRQGNMLAILHDQHMGQGEPLSFFGQPAHTALSAAQLALKYDALLVPVYAIRQPDGISFKVVLEAPVPHSDERQMMQALNDSLEARVRAHMGQWLWTHQRWKGHKPGKRKARKG